MITDKYTLHLNEVNVENAAEMEKYKAGAGLVQLGSALAKLNKGVKNAYKRDQKGFLDRVNVTEKVMSGPFSGDGGIGGGSLNIQGIREYCLQVLTCNAMCILGDLYVFVCWHKSSMRMSY